MFKGEQSFFTKEKTAIKYYRIKDMSEITDPDEIAWLVNGCPSLQKEEKIKEEKYGNLKGIDRGYVFVVLDPKTKKPIYAGAETQGMRPNQEDSCFSLADERLEKLTEEQLKQLLETIIKDLATNKEILNYCEEKDNEGACALLTINIPKKGVSVTAHLGDSTNIVMEYKKGGAVSSSEIINKPLHKPTLKSEKERIEKTVVGEDGSIKLSVANGRIKIGYMSGIAVSGAIGDSFYKGAVRKNPDVHVKQLEKQDDMNAMSICACDGLTETWTETDIAEFITKNKDKPLHYLVRDIVLESINKKAKLENIEINNGSKDNVTVILVPMDKSFPPSFNAIFDGHGGAWVAQHCRSILDDIYEKNLIKILGHEYKEIVSQEPQKELEITNKGEEKILNDDSQKQSMLRRATTSRVPLNASVKQSSEEMKFNTMSHEQAKNLLSQIQDYVMSYKFKYSGTKAVFLTSNKKETNLIPKRAEEFLMMIHSEIELTKKQLGSKEKLDCNALLDRVFRQGNTNEKVVEQKINKILSANKDKESNKVKEESKEKKSKNPIKKLKHSKQAGKLEKLREERDFFSAFSNLDNLYEDIKKNLETHTKTRLRSGSKAMTLPDLEDDAHGKQPTSRFTTLS